jgi:hypothetical protein
MEQAILASDRDQKLLADNGYLWNAVLWIYEHRREIDHPIDAKRDHITYEAARSMERAALPRSVAMALGGWRSESMYRRYAIASEADLREGVRRLAAAGH